MTWPSLKAQWQKVLDSPPHVKPPKLTQPVSERDRLRVERPLTQVEKDELRREMEEQRR